MFMMKKKLPSAYNVIIITMIKVISLRGNFFPTHSEKWNICCEFEMERLYRSEEAEEFLNEMGIATVIKYI